MAAICFEDAFNVIGVDSEKFEHVHRIKCTGQSYASNLEFDVNSDLFPLQPKDTVRVALASTRTNIAEQWEGRIQSTSISQLAESYEYVMYGKVYMKCKADSSKKAPGSMDVDSMYQVYCSFGGLLLLIEADESDLEALILDDRVYLLMRRVY